jgi:hypothetical protein
MNPTERDAVRFFPGQRVRMSPKGIKTFPELRARLGMVRVVIPVPYQDSAVLRQVLLHIFRGHSGRLEQLGCDETAVALAYEVLRGNTVAAVLLADRVMELYGATPTPTRSSS